jgi:hypothetical protein
MKKGFSVLFVLGVFFVVGAVTPHYAYGATLYMDPASTTLKRGDTMKISVRIDAGEDECVNVVDAVINFTENIQPVDISRGSSILSMWVEEPVIDKVKRTITFAGGIPNGYCGRIPGDPRLTNNVVDLLFASPGLQIGSTESGSEVAINFAPETRVLLNDGFGTTASTSFFGAQIHLTKEAGTEVLNPWLEAIQNDNTIPEKFSIAVERTTNAYSNDYFITFNTTDKQSGIDHYEVIEEPLDSKNLFGWGAVTAPWVTAQSPYVLDDQSLNSTIRVKAIDKAGNEYIATLVPEEGKRSLSFANKIIIGVGIFIGLLFITLIVAFIVWYRRRKIQPSAEEVIIVEPKK